MSFLTDSVLVLDAILTDEGRRRMAAGNFDIRKFSLSDDEIVYDKALESQPNSKFANTPIFEAVSENSKALKYLLMSSRLDSTHLNSTLLVTDTSQGGTAKSSTDDYIIIATKTTYDSKFAAANLPAGYLKGYDKTLISKNSNSWIYIDHGVNDDGANSPYNFKQLLPADLEETQVLVKLDYRLGRVLVPNTDPGQELHPISVDDDFIATYLITRESQDGSPFWQDLQQNEAASPIKGARGPRLRIPVAAAPNINVASDAIWTALGSTDTTSFTDGSTAKNITNVMIVEGLTTNLNISVPLKFIKV